MIDLTLKDLAKLRADPHAELMRAEYSVQWAKRRRRQSEPYYFRSGLIPPLPKVEREEECGSLTCKAN